MAKRKLGFTMIEVLVATVLLGLGITMGFSALSSMTRTELRVRQVEKMNLLAVQKLNEVIAYGNIANQQLLPEPTTLLPSASRLKLQTTRPRTQPPVQTD